MFDDLGSQSTPSHGRKILVGCLSWSMHKTAVSSK